MPTAPRTPPERRLSFYRKLSSALKREYDRSDALRRIPVAPSRTLAEAAAALVGALEEGKRPAVAEAAQGLVSLLCRALARENRTPVPPPVVKVMRVRPSSAGGEFHGLYTRTEKGETEIKVWMFTARERRVVRPRTFLRTLLHEVVHHLDFVVFDLPNSLHTLGFHARESSLLDALERSGAVVPGGRKPARERGGAAPAAPASRRPERPRPEAKTKPRAKSPTPVKSRQLDLFDSD